PAARGSIPDPHPLCLGPLRSDAGILARADLVLALGLEADELDAARVTLSMPVVRLGRGADDVDGDVATLLEELAPRLRDRTRADWDVAELDRLRRAMPAPAVTPVVAALVTRLREATPAGTVAVFGRELEAATPLWQAVAPGEVLVRDAVIPA